MTHPGLPRQTVWKAASSYFMPNKIQDLFGNALGNWVRWRKNRTTVLLIVKQYGHHSVGVHVDKGFADAVGGPVNGDRHSIGRVFRNENIVNARQFRRFAVAQLDNYFLRHLDKGGRASLRTWLEPRPPFQ